MTKIQIRRKKKEKKEERVEKKIFRIKRHRRGSNQEPFDIKHASCTFRTDNEHVDTSFVRIIKFGILNKTRA